MESKVSYAIVGAFVLTLGVALIGAVLWLASGGALKKDYDTYLAVVGESVSGLNVNAPIKYHGVDVGKVRAIRLHPDDPQLVQLTFAIEHGTPIKVDTEAVLKLQGLTGIAYVELTGGSRDAAPLRPPRPGAPPVIRTRPSLSAQLENVATRVLANLDQTAANINDLLSAENRAAIKQTLGEIAALTSGVASQKDALRRGIASAARAADNTARATERLDIAIARIRTSAEAIERLANEAAKATVSAEQTVSAVGGGARRFSGQTLPEIERLLGELNALSASLRRLSDQTERNPSSLLLGNRPAPGPGE